MHVLLRPPFFSLGSTEYPYRGTRPWGQSIQCGVLQDVCTWKGTVGIRGRQ